MYYFSEGDLIGAVLACRRGEKPYWWYRDVLRQAEERGLIRVTGHSEQVPFWWRKFDESVEVLSKRLREGIAFEGNIGQDDSKAAFECRVRCQKGHEFTLLWRRGDHMPEHWACGCKAVLGEAKILSKTPYKELG